MIKTLILQTTFGQIFYSKEGFFGEDVGESDISLTAGLISAIYSMTEETQAQKIEEIELEDLRSVFRELPGDKLFIITVDKRMDTSDADDLLQGVIDGFADKYGMDYQSDGMILNDFEDVVDDIIADKLWYNSITNRLVPGDLLTFIAIMFSVIWYPFWFMRASTNIIAPLFSGNGFSALMLGIIKVLAGTILPLVITLFLLGKFSNMKLPFRYTKEFLRRPTRGGYAELFPVWFFVLPLFIMAGLSSIVVFGRGINHALKAEAFHDGFVNAWQSVNPNTGEVTLLFWSHLYYYLFFYFFTWYVVFPLIIAVVTENVNRNFIFSVMIIVSISLIVIIPAHIISGKVYAEQVGFFPNDRVAWSTASSSVAFLIAITLPVNIFIAANIFFLGVGIGRLINKNKSRFTVSFGVAVLAVLQLLEFFWWLVFQSGLLIFLKFF